MRRASFALALAGLGVLATQASAHNASVTCSPGGQYVVATDFNQFNPVTTFTPTTAVVAWSDGYRLTLPLPAPCEPPVQPEPAPVPAVVVPQPGPVTPMPVNKPNPRPRKQPRVVTCRFVVSHFKGAARTRMIGKYHLPKTCGRPFNPPVTG